jgi:hypothetical protein
MEKTTMSKDTPSMMAQVLESMPKDIQKKFMMGLLEKACEDFSTHDEQRQMELTTTVHQLHAEMGKAIHDLSNDIEMVNRCMHTIEAYNAKKLQTAETT